MSNSTRQGGYDERLVVPLEASRRGAHRARANAIVAALPLLAVVVVVAAVIGIAYTLFLKPSTTSTSSDTAGQPLPTVSSQPPAASSAPRATATSRGEASTSPSATTSASASTTSAAVDTSVSFRVYNGSVGPVSGLGRKAVAALKADGWSGASVVVATAPVTTLTTRVYYGASKDQPTAAAIVKSLGVGSTRLNTGIAGQGIVVVIGNDFPH
ncbi:MAG TPA: LytR C-terminal domain-containing protein [Kineosporiaceae bacterium]|nr:LytR C-terminal domain-containing protein [Kineosporiaceae bacterium]